VSQRAGPDGDAAHAPACAHNAGAQSIQPTVRLKEITMPKGQRSSKEVKKPKKDQSPGKVVSPDAVMPTKVTVVPERSKKK
jgi:hypothetical protein